MYLFYIVWTVSLKIRPTTFDGSPVRGKDDIQFHHLNRIKNVYHIFANDPRKIEKKKN